MNELINEIEYRISTLSPTGWCSIDPIILAHHFMVYVYTEYRNLFSETWICETYDGHYVNSIDVNGRTIIIDLSQPAFGLSKSGIYELTEENFVKNNGVEVDELINNGDNTISDDIYNSIEDLFEGIDLNSI